MRSGQELHQTPTTGTTSSRITRCNLPVHATFFQGKDYPVIISEVSRPQPTGEQVLVRMKWAALNHLDIWIWREQSLSPGMKITLGADGSGIVEAAGENADQSMIGREVIINPSLDWGNSPVVQGDNYRILGFPDNGTFADYLLISKKYVYPKP